MIVGVVCVAAVAVSFHIAVHAVVSGNCTHHSNLPCLVAASQPVVSRNGAAECFVSARGYLGFLSLCETKAAVLTTSLLTYRISRVVKKNVCALVRPGAEEKKA